MAPVIEVDGLSKEYVMGDDVVHALRGVSFQVQPGAFMALMGPSGSGKSTLMHLLGCLDSPTSGCYILNGREVGNLSRSARSEVRSLISEGPGTLRSVSNMVQGLPFAPDLSEIIAETGLYAEAQETVELFSRGGQHERGKG